MALWKRTAAAVGVAVLAITGVVGGILARTHHDPAKTSAISGGSAASAASATAAISTTAATSAPSGASTTAATPASGQAPGSFVRITARGEAGSSASQLSASFTVARQRVAAARLPFTAVSGDATSLTVVTPQADQAIATALLRPGRLDFRPVLRSAAASTATGSWNFTAGANQIQITDLYTTQACAASTLPASSGNAPGIIDYLSTCGADGTAKYLLGPVGIAGTDVTGATAAGDAKSGEWIVDVSFDAKGSQDLASVTRRLAASGGQLAIVLDAVVESAPSVQEAITGGQLQIAGTFTQTQAQELAAVLSYGALPAALQIQTSPVGQSGG